MRKIGSAFLLIFTLTFFLTCASNSGTVSSDAVSVSSSSSKKRDFFSAVNPRALQLFQIGSAQSLKQASSIIHKSNSENYTEAEKTLLYVSAQIMQILWQSENVTWDAPLPAKTNQYLGAVESSLRGIYDSSTTRSDFFSLLLPSLAIFSSADLSANFDSMETSILASLQINGESVLANYILGTLYLKKKENEKALECFKKCNGKYSSGSKEIVESLAKTCFLLENYELALSFGEELLSRYPQDVELLKLSALSSYRLGDTEKTEGFVVRILLLEPNDMDFLLLRARILMQKGDFIRASSLLDIAEKKNSRTKEFYILRTILLRDWNKNNALAVETAGESLTRFPDDLDVLVMAAQTSASTGLSVNGMQAAEISRNILNHHPDNESAMKIFISESVKKSDFAGAYEFSSRLVKKNPHDNESVLNHVEICLALKKNSEAQEIATSLYTENPSDENACMAYIKVLVALNQRNAASSLIALLIPSANQRMKSFLYFQRSFLQTTEDAVLSDLRSSLTSNPRNKDSLYKLYEIYYAKKDWRRAQYYLKQVVALDSSNAALLKKNSELDALLGR
jgi:tetratricopeptide (TPR) repeat protein